MHTDVLILVLHSYSSLSLEKLHDEVDNHGPKQHGLDDGEELLRGRRLVLLALGRHLSVQEGLNGAEGGRSRTNMQLCQY